MIAMNVEVGETSYLITNGRVRTHDTISFDVVSLALLDGWASEYGLTRAAFSKARKVMKYFAGDNWKANLKELK